MKRLTTLSAALSLALAPAAHAQFLPSTPASGSPRPGYCPAAYQTLTFQTQAFTSANVDTGKTLSSGYQWYYSHFGSGFTAGDSITLNGDGSASVTGNSGPNGQMLSAVQISGSPYFVGTAFGGGFCVEAQVSFNAAAVNNANGQPAFWAMANEHLSEAGSSRNTDQWTGQATGYEHFIEMDFLEYFNAPAPQYLGSVIDWYGIYNSTCTAFCNVAYSFPSAAAASAFRTGLDWTQWHRVGAVWVPATGSTSGTLQYFMDGQPLGPAMSWSQYTSQSPPPTSSSPWLFGMADGQHQVLIFGSNTTPINVKSLVVYQASAANNVTN